MNPSSPAKPQAWRSLIPLTPSTKPRSLSTASSRGKHFASPSRCDTPTYEDDRFIHSRENLHMELCRRSHLSAKREKVWKPPLQMEYEEHLLNSICELPTSRHNDQELDILPRRKGILLTTSNRTESFWHTDTDWARQVGGVTDQSLFSVGRHGRLAIAYGAYFDVIETSKTPEERSFFYYDPEDYDISGDKGDITVLSWCPQPGNEHIIYKANGKGHQSLVDLNDIDGGAQSLDPIPQYGEDDCISCCDWHPTTDKFLVAGYQDGGLLFSDMRIDPIRNAPIIVGRRALKGQSTKLSKIKWNCDGSGILIALTDENGSWIQYCDIRYVSDNYKSICNKSVWTVKQNGSLNDLEWCHSSRNRFVTLGTAQKGDELRLHDVNTGNVITSVNTQSETTNLVSSPNGPELCTSHGKHNHEAACDNSLQLWKYDENTLTPTKGIRTGKDDPIVNMELNPKRNTDVVTLAADGTVRIYDVFQQESVLPFTSKQVRSNAKSKVPNLSCAMNPSHMWDLGIPDLSGITGLNIR